jgi:hypothetical protein
LLLVDSLSLLGFVKIDRDKDPNSNDGTHVFDVKNSVSRPFIGLPESQNRGCPWMSVIEQLKGQEEAEHIWKKNILDIRTS